MSYRGHSRNRGTYSNNSYYNSNSHQNYNNNNNNNRQNNSHVPGNNFYAKVNEHNNQNKVWVEIKGWTNASKENLISFISRKTSLALRDAEAQGDTIRASLFNEKDANYLKSFSGIRFAGDTLKITVLPSIGVNTQSSSTASTLDMFKGFLHRRYNPQARLLDLTNIASDPELASLGLFANMNTSSKMFPALMKVVSTESYVNNVDSVSLAENSIVDGMTITSLAQTFPFLKNLSLASNQISKLKALDNFKHKLNSLKELILMGNPIVNDPGYKSEMLHLFPRLILLDSQPVRDENKLKEIWRFPLPRVQFFFENPQIQNLSTDFISNFLNFWDNDRSQLLSLYTPESQFSISVDTTSPFLQSNSENIYQDKHNAPWGYYLPVSRNLTKIATPQVVKARLGKGQEEILRLFKNLPKTKHSLATNPEKYSTDSWKISDNAIMFVLHGEFEEIAPPEQQKTASSTLPKNPRRGYHSSNNKSGNSATALSIRSFDRTWLVVSSGPSFVIASDLLTLRPYAGFEQWKPDATAATATASGVNPASASAPGSSSATPVPSLTSGVNNQIPATVAITGGIPEATAANVVIPPEIASKLAQPQQELLVKLMVDTKLNINFAGMLAEESHWDYNQALQTFNASKANIPPDAFRV